MDGRYNGVNIPNAKDTPEVEAIDVSHHEYEPTHANGSVLSLVQPHFNEYSSGTHRKIYGLPSNESRISLLSCYHFPVAKLAQTFNQGRGTEQPVDSVVVKFALYGKKLKAPYHEFLMFELGNTQDPCLRNHVVLDRHRLDGVSVLSSVQKSKSAAAQDEFRFSCDGNREKLLRRCDLTPYEAIETLEFVPGGLLPFYELASVACATSLQRDYYHLLDANCYWFAGLIWEQVLEMYREAKHEVLRDGVRGKFGSLFSQTSDEFEREEIVIKIQAMLSRMEAIITEVQRVWPTSGGEDSRRMNTQGRHDSVNPGPSLAPNALNAGQSLNTKETRFTTPNIPSPKIPSSEIPNPKFPDHKLPNRTSFALMNIAVVLARRIPQRNSARTESESIHRRLSCSYEERHKQIFPAGFDSISSSNSTQRLCYSFPPERLYDVLTSGYSPEHHVEDIIVKSASYCKKNTSPKHEFIIIEVEDRRSPGLRNFIALDRNISEANRPTAIFTNIQISSFVPKDEFRVSYDGNKKRLLVQCDLQDHEVLETLTFKSSEPLLLYQLATLTRAVSSQRDKHLTISANCYWFAGLIWDCMVRMRPSAYHKVSQGQIRGAFLSWLRQSSNSVELQVTYAYVEQELLDVEKKVIIQKQRWNQSHDAQLYDELENMRRRVRELEELVPNPDTYHHH